MATITRKVYLTFPPDKVTEPIICCMYDQLKVRFNIRSASISDHVGIVALELMADKHEQIDKALEFFRAHGVTAEPIEMDVITG